MKKIIAMIGMGAVLCMVPSCKKSNLIPREAMASNQTEQRAPGQPLPEVDNTTLYVMLASKSCITPQKEFTSLIVDIKGIEVFYDKIGWQTLPVIANGWDLIAMQQGITRGLNLTERVAAHAGRISQVIITFGDNNKLAVNGMGVSCFRLGTQHITLDLKGDVQKDAANEMLLAMDICGNIGTQAISDDNPCYVLKPVVDFGGISQKMIK